MRLCLDSHVACARLQIEDLNQQAQMAAAEKFRDKPPAGPGDIPSTVAQPIQEESEEEEEVGKPFVLTWFAWLQDHTFYPFSIALI